MPKSNSLALSTKSLLTSLAVLLRTLFDEGLSVRMSIFLPWPCDVCPWVPVLVNITASSPACKRWSEPPTSRWLYQSPREDSNHVSASKNRHTPEYSLWTCELNSCWSNRNHNLHKELTQWPTNWLGFQGHGFKGQGHRNVIQRRHTDWWVAVMTLHNSWSVVNNDRLSFISHTRNTFYGTCICPML